jgi:hypothetical protein
MISRFDGRGRKLAEHLVLRKSRPTFRQLDPVRHENLAIGIPDKSASHAPVIGTRRKIQLHCYLDPLCAAGIGGKQ